MEGIYVPRIESGTAWPESLRKDFSGQLHRFMASLIETANQAKGKTVLYVPREAESLTEKDAEDKDLVQRLESAVIHWTRQIKEVLAHQDTSVQSESAGPLEEIEFWRRRTVDLSGIREQLGLPGVLNIIKVLESINSSYLGPFDKLARRIKEGSAEADDNLKFLSILKEDCEALHLASPVEIPSILPRVLTRIRVISNVARHYHSKERLVGLLYKISNEVIHRCRANISLEDLFDGNVLSVVKVLNDSIACGFQWRRLYKETATAVEESPSTPPGRVWDFDDSAIFAQVEAFVQRCKELLDVAEGQIQFSRKTEPDGSKGKLPAFGGARGSEIAKSLKLIETQFDEHISRIKNLRQEILDVKSTRWHDEYNYFKETMRNLEHMMQNVINVAFDDVTTVKRGVHLLEAFSQLAHRGGIKHTMQKKTAEVYSLFIRKMQEVKRYFEENKSEPPLRLEEPQYAGAALWARGLMASVDKDKEALDACHFVVRGKEAEDADGIYDRLVASIEEYMQEQHSAWNAEFQEAEPQALHQRLNNPLLVRAAGDPTMVQRGKGGLLESNFDKTLLRLFAEVHYWNKFEGKFLVPFYAQDLYNNQRETLRILRENVMLVVREYNQILSALASDEVRLFRQVISKLDRSIIPGLNKYTWARAREVQAYVTSARKMCAEVYATVQAFKKNRRRIERLCSSIAATSLVRIDKNYVHPEGVFEAHQKEHRTQARERLQRYHKEIRRTMAEMYETFAKHALDVQREWAGFVRKVDENIERSLRSTVKASLQELSRAIVGEGSKTDPIPLFRVQLVLVHDKVEFKPSIMNLTQMVNVVSKELITVIAVVPRLAVVLRDEIQGYKASTSAIKAAAQSQMGVGGARAAMSGRDGEEKGDDGKDEEDSWPSFYDNISNEEEILKILVAIMNGMSSSVTLLKKDLHRWEKYRHLWDADKAQFRRRYAKRDWPLKQYKIDIDEFRRQENDIRQADESLRLPFGCVSLDASRLREALIRHARQWQDLLCNLLNENARKELRELHFLMKDTSTQLMSEPRNLDELSTSIRTLNHFKTNKESIEQRFAPVEEMYELLASYDVQVPEEEVNMLQNLRGEWDEFQGMLAEADQMLMNSKTGMKKGLQQELEKFTSDITELRESSLKGLPTGSDLSVGDAKEILAEYRSKVKSFRKKEDELKPGLEIFEIAAPEHSELVDLEKDLENLTQIWGLMEDWEISWESWKKGKFGDLDVETMNTAALQLNKNVGRMRDMSKTGVWKTLKQKIETFLKTLPLIQNLRNPAMRPRHWGQLMEHIGVNFEPEADDFTMERVFDLGLATHADFIGELSDTANKELNIEQSLATIESTWQDIDIEMGEYKDGVYKIKSTEELSQQLEDDLVSLSTMKASRFFLSFEKPILSWEKSLSLVSEVIEVTLNVQRQWMYLESIFLASEDIRRQLPKESALFEQVNKRYCLIMDTMHADPNALRACSQEGLLDDLNEMDEKLQTIQKSLDMYLETKRRRFPRFYFLSNDDLLEILGQQRNPEQVQKHIKKCFEGIKRLDMELNNQKWEVSGMNAPDGENVKFVAHFLAAGPVEEWLIRVEEAMIRSMKRELKSSLELYRNKTKWIEAVPGQMLISGGMIMFSNNVTAALNAIQKGTKNALRVQRKKQVSYLNKLAAFVRQDIDKIKRKKLVALITMELHSRDIMERMIKAGCKDVTDFDWLAQLRLYFEPSLGEFGECIVKQTNCQLTYGYEYQGNNGRLVVTPLTDRCVLTLTTALHLQRGGSPMGPAGTGKTETVKDLGKNLAKFVVVFNCSDGLDYKSVGRMFSGLVQSGGWGCFDEFNRIEIEVLSVIAQQIMSIMSAIKARQTEFEFMGAIIPCNWNMGIFITMNPGYAGRTELPDNLKSLFRPVAMMVPDMALIAEVMLQAEGFENSRVLAKKTVTLYGLMVQQLSKQDHYDYGLRSMRGVLVAAGAIKRKEPEANEEYIMLRAIRDMNLPKFIKADAQLFKLLLGDLFPSLELPPFEGGDLGVEIESQLLNGGYQKHNAIVQKCIELRDSKATRHCNMLVGRTLSGKSVCWKMLAKARSALADSVGGEYMKVKYEVINPKSVNMHELYGYYDLQTMEWTDGILSKVFRDFARDEKPEEKWLILDGPVDTLWIESMNTVMDDNKTLTLINGDRIAMSNYMSLIFEVQDLAVASPATVSRAGMVYLDVEDLGWQPFVTSWIERMFPNQDERDFFKELFDKYVPKLLDTKRRVVKEPVSITDFNAVTSLCKLYEALATPANGLDRATDPDGYFPLAEKWFAFCLVWSIGGSADENGRRRLNDTLRDIEAFFPPVQTVYEYYIDPASKDFKLWSDRLSTSWRPPKDAPFNSIIVPTVDTMRNRFIINTLVNARRHVLCVGATGTGKTVTIKQDLDSLSAEEWARVTLNFSAATASHSVQDIIEGVLEKRAKNKLGPPASRKLVAFVDDLNMPKKDEFGSQPPLELLRQWVDYGGWYERAKQSWRYIVDMQLVAAMGPPGGGRTTISERFQSRFNVINFTFPSESQISRIFESILAPKLEEFDEEISPLARPIVTATINVYHKVVEQFLPTPTKAHYLFNIRDIARVIQGVLQASKAVFHTKEEMARLWVHESLRIFSDRFINYADQEKFRGILDEQLGKNLDLSYARLMEDAEQPEAGPVYCDFMSPPAGDEWVYEEVKDLDALKEGLDIKLEDYNMEPGFLQMNLVMFRDAMRHCCRIQRIIRQPRGNALLVGVGGSGRQSLTRLAAYVSEMSLFTIEITKNYRQIEFHENLRDLYYKTGVENKATVFLFSDTQIKEESFLEDINNILSSGQVPNLYGKDDKVQVLDELRPVAKKEGILDNDGIWNFFIDRVRSNLHVVLTMSPVGDGFRNRTRQYPSLVNCTTIDWFHEWPEDALREVAVKFLSSLTLASEESKGGDADEANDAIRQRIAKVFATMHRSVVDSSGRMLLELKRHNYVTPTNYLELVAGYRDLLQEKRQELGDARDKLQNGLTKLDESRVQVEEMGKELVVKKEVVDQKSKQCEDLLVVIVSERHVADEQEKFVKAEKARIAEKEKEAMGIAEATESELARALPALNRAMAEVDKLDKSSISEVKAYTQPPDAVMMVLGAVMVLFRQKADWPTAKKKISEANFLSQVKNYPKDDVTPEMLKKVRKYTTLKNFVPEDVAKSSAAAAALCVWVKAIEVYAEVAREVEPKRRAHKEAMDDLKKTQEELAVTEQKYEEVKAKVAELNDKHQKSLAEKNELQDEAENLEMKLNRASQLVDGLSGERVRWEKSITEYEKRLYHLTGDGLVAAAFLSYAGPFDTAYRKDLVKKWLNTVKEQEIPFTADFNFATFLANPEDVRDWNIQGLPKDEFSSENGVIVTRGRRWPLMIDPQGQANKWVKKMEGKQLKICDLKTKDFLRQLETAITYGMPYLLQDVEEELDPALEPVLNKAIVKQGTRKMIKLGDSMIDYSDDFKMYITTKLPNPHYTPEVSTKATIVNFAVKEEGLEAQLLGIVVGMEKPELETKKSALVVSVAKGKRKLVELENEILRLLSTAEGSLLDDENLVNTLQASKSTSEEVTESLKVAEETEVKIDAAREEYRGVASRAALLFFVLNDLSSVDPMYQFSLDTYVEKFQGSIETSRDPKNLEELGPAILSLAMGGGADELKARIEIINSFHTYAIYKYACGGLFERHKLLLSLQICMKKLQREGKIPKVRWFQRMCFHWRTDE